MSGHMVVLWDSDWHQVRPDTEEERTFARENGGEVVRAGIESPRLADRLCYRLNTALYRRQLEGGQAVFRESRPFSERLTKFADWY